MTSGLAVMDAPLIPGKRVVIRQMRAVDFQDGGRERKWYRIWIGNETHAAVMSGGLLKPGMILCSDHDGECEHKIALRASHLLED